MTRLCLSCSGNSKETSCICMATAMEKYSLTEGQIAKARIPIITRAIPNGNLKLLPESIVRECALKTHGSMADIQLVFEKSMRVRMAKYNIQFSRWELELKSFDDWVESAESIWGTDYGAWPGNGGKYYFAEKERLKKKPKFPRQEFESDIYTYTTGREARTTKYLVRKAG